MRNNETKANKKIPAENANIHGLIFKSSLVDKAISGITS